jgi:hypothetical protein
MKFQTEDPEALGERLRNLIARDLCADVLVDFAQPVYLKYFSE